MRKLPVLSIGLTLEEGVITISDEEKLRGLQESVWQLGYASIGGRALEVQRRWDLDEWVYRYKDTIIDPKGVEGYQHSEWFDWRDGTKDN